MPEPLVTYPTTSTCGFRLGGRITPNLEGGGWNASEREGQGGPPVTGPRADVGLGPALTASTPGPPAGTEPQVGRETTPEEM